MYFKYLSNSAHVVYFTLTFIVSNQMITFGILFF